MSGCTHNCPGCFNQDYQIFNYGENGIIRSKKELQKQISLPQIAGLTLLGGEPMQNLEGLIILLRRLRKFLAKNNLDKNIWLYSGYTYEQIINNRDKLELLNLVDVLVDGLYIDELKRST